MIFHKAWESKSIQRLIDKRFKSLFWKLKLNVKRKAETTPNTETSRSPCACRLHALLLLLLYAPWLYLLCATFFSLLKKITIILGFVWKLFSWNMRSSVNQNLEHARKWKGANFDNILKLFSRKYFHLAVLIKDYRKIEKKIYLSMQCKLLYFYLFPGLVILLLSLSLSLFFL